MKKKIIALTVLVVLVLCIAMTGCTFIRVNNERKANEIMATVSIQDNGQTYSLNVTRNELLSYVNYLISLYSNYGMQYDAKTLIEQGLDSLVNQKKLVLRGMVYLCGIEARQDVMYAKTDAYKAVYGTQLTPEGVLTVSERYASIASTNESFVSSIEKYIEDYESEKRELTVTDAKEQLASAYQDGFTVKEDGVKVVHKVAVSDENPDGYADGLYTDSIVAAKSDDSTETDYLQIVLAITLEKSGSKDKTVYLPVTSAAVSTEEKENAEFVSAYITAKVCKVTYDEPVTGEDGEVTYNSHVAEADFTLVSPRPAFAEEEKEDETDLENGDVPFRYVALSEFEAATEGKLFEIREDGKIFEHTLTAYSSDAEKDAYRQFRESKKSMNINFTATADDCYNGLGYYYLSSFESAVLSAVKHELKKAYLSDNPVSEDSVAEQYEILVKKQAEEYSVLSNKEQVDKFAEAIKEDLSSVYYVPIEALLSESYEVDPTDAAYSALFTLDGDNNVVDYNHDYVTAEDDGTYTMRYAVANSDGTYTINFFYVSDCLFNWTDELKSVIEKDLKDYTDDNELKGMKQLLVKYLNTNKSIIDSEKEDADKLLEDVFVTEDGKIKNFSVEEVITDMMTDVAGAEDHLAEFKKYMSLYNDDPGAMSSKLGYVVTVGEIMSQWVTEYTEVARAIYFKNLVDESVTDITNSPYISEVALTDYGPQFAYVSFAPFYHVAIDKNGGLGVNKEITPDGKKVAETLLESLESQAETNVYNQWTNANAEEKNGDAVAKDSKKMKNLLKDLGLK